MNQDRNADISADPAATQADPAEVLAHSLQTAVAGVARLARRFRKRATDDFDEVEYALMVACGAATKLSGARDGQAANNERLGKLIKKLMRRFADHVSESARKLKGDKDRRKGDGDGDGHGHGHGAANTAEPKNKERKSRKGQKYNKERRSSVEKKDMSFSGEKQM